MIKPIVNKINTFDPAFDYIFSFTYNGNQSVSNRLIITDNDTNSVIYDETIISMKLQHTLPANKLESNKQYSAQFQCFDSSGTASLLSDKAYFYCLKTPVFEFTNVVSMIENSSYEFMLNYSQVESEQLKEYKIILYDSSRTEVIRDSGILYATKGISQITYGINALDDDTKYYIQAFGTTVHGMEIETDKYEFYVSYIRPSQYSAFYTENDAENGCIKYSTNIVVISYNGDEEFEYRNGYINLMDKKLYYNTGFNLSGDFVVKLIGAWLRHGEIFRMSNSNYSITLEVLHDEFSNYKIVMKAENSLTSYVLFSDSFIYNASDHVFITFYRKDGYYGIKVDVRNGNMAFADMYIGNTIPTTATTNGIYIYKESMDTIKINQEDVNIIVSSTKPTEAKNFDIWIKKEKEDE